jgi:hypothetical protein
MRRCGKERLAKGLQGEGIKGLALGQNVGKTGAEERYGGCGP